MDFKLVSAFSFTKHYPCATHEDDAPFSENMDDEKATVTGIASAASARCPSPTIELKKVGKSWKIKVDGKYLKVPANTFLPTEHIEVDGSYILTENDCFHVKPDSSGQWCLYPTDEINVAGKSLSDDTTAKKVAASRNENVQYTRNSTEFDSRPTDTSDSGRLDKVRLDDSVPDRNTNDVHTSSECHVSMVDKDCWSDDAIACRKSNDIQTSSDCHVSLVSIDCGSEDDAVPDSKSNNVQTSSDCHVSLVDIDVGLSQDLSSEKTSPLNGGPRVSTKTRSPDIVLGKLIMHANIGPLSQVQADSLIYLWEKNYMYNVNIKDHKLLKEMRKETGQFTRHRDIKTDRYKILTTKGGNIRVKRVIHIPCDWNDLQRCLTNGLHTADMGQSAVIFFESTHQFLKFGSKLGDCLVQTIANVSPSLKTLQRLVVNLETKESAAKVIDSFKSNTQPSKPMPPEKKQFTVMMGGPKEEVEKLKSELEYLEDKQDEQGGQQSSQMSAPGPMSMDKGLEEGMGEKYYSFAQQPGPAPRRHPQPVTSVKFTTDTYVEIHTVLDVYGDEATLKQAMFVRGFPIPSPALVFAQQMKRAVLICGTKEEASKLCKFTGCKDISFQLLPQIARNNATLHVKRGGFYELTKAEHFELKRKLENAQIELLVGDTCLLKAPTLCQVYYGKSLLEQYGLFNDDKGNKKEKKSECEFILTLSDTQFKIFKSEVKGVNKQIVKHWTVDGMEDGTGTVAVTLDPQHESFKDMILDKDSWVKSLSIEEVPCNNKTAQEVRQLCKDIEAENKVPCCMYDQANSRCIIYHESFEELQKVKHQLNVKLGNVRITARRKREFTNVSQSVEPSSR